MALPLQQQEEKWVVLGDVKPGSDPLLRPISIVTTDNSKTCGTVTIHDSVSVCHPKFGEPPHGDKYQSIFAAHDGGPWVASLEKIYMTASQIKNGHNSAEQVHYSAEQAHYVTYVLQLYDVTSTTPAACSVPVPEEPYAMYIRDKAVYLGFSRSVGWIDFSDEHPVYEHLYNNGHDKGYDMFVLLEDNDEGDGISYSYLIAIDDCCFPFYADTFLLDWSGKGRPIHIRHWGLPSLINGSYTMAAVSAAPIVDAASSGREDKHASGTKNSASPSPPPATKAQFQLILASDFCCRNVSGQNLYRLSYDANSFASRNTGEARTELRGDDGSIENSLSGKTLTVPRSMHNPSGGERWHAMAVTANDRLLIAMEEQGLLSLPLNFESNTQADVVIPSDRLGDTESFVVKDVTTTRMGKDIWVLLAPGEVSRGEFSTDKLLFEWHLVKLTTADNGRLGIQIRIPIQGSHTLHFVACNGRTRCSYRRIEDELSHDSNPEDL